MTLLKQTTVSKADDSLTRPENDDDLQTDCCQFSLTSGSLEKELQTLTLSDRKSGKTEHSCESGIASFSANYSIQYTDTAHFDHHTERESGPSLIQNNRTTTETERACVTDDVWLKAGERGVVSDFEGTLTDCRRKKDKSERNADCYLWEEMCGTFPDKDGDTLLHLAVLQTVTHLAHLVRYLGLKGQVNCRNRLYQTPLHLAVLTSNTPALTLLRSLGASPCLQDCRGNTPLHSACLKNDPRALKMLLEGQDEEDPGHTESETGPREGEVSPGSASPRSIDDLDLLAVGCPSRKEPRGHELAEGCDVDSQRESLESASFSEGEKITLTGDVGVEGDEKDSGRRLEREVKVALCAKNYEGFTCLHLAVLRGNVDLVSLLLQHGADVNARDGKSGRTALHLAVDTPHPSPAILSSLFLHPHLHINATNFAQQTALQLARGRHHLDLVDALHMRGARWSDSIHGYSSSDSFSEEDLEEDLFVPYDDLRVAGQLLTATSCS